MSTRIREILESFNRLGIINRGRVDDRALAKARFASLIDAAESSAQATSDADTTAEPHLDSYCASLTLAGSYEYCNELDCRLGKVDELARYAALYADRVVVHNLVADHSPSLGHPPDKDTNWFRQRLSNDLKVILSVAPLINAGLVVPLTPVRTACPACASAQLFGSGADRRLRKAEKSLQHRYFELTDVEFYFDDENERYCLDCDGPEPLFVHGSLTWLYDEPCAALAGMPRLMSKVRSGERVSVSKTVRRKLGVHKDLANLAIEMLSYQLITSELLGISLVTDQKLDAELLDVISNQQGDGSTPVTASNIDVLVPFAGDVPITQLVRLRKREEDSFIRFRAALREAAREYSDANGRLSRRRARALYADVIEPALAELDHKVKRSKRDLISTPLKSAAGTVAALGLGIYTGIIPSELAAAAQTLGVSKIVYDTIVQAANSSNAKTSGSQYYFLWRVRHASSKRCHSHSDAT